MNPTVDDLPFAEALTRPCTVCGAQPGEQCFRLVVPGDPNARYGLREGPPKPLPHRSRRIPTNQEQAAARRGGRTPK